MLRLLPNWSCLYFDRKWNRGLVPRLAIHDHHILFCFVFRQLKVSGGSEPVQKAEKSLAAESQKAKPTNIANSGWGEVFKNRQNFVDMHIC